ncbi:MAG TPA: serine/threonine-protein kinase [Ktedonobacteraceae bacterium]
MQKRFNHYYLTEQIGSKPLRSAYLAHHVNDVSQKVLIKIFDATCLALGQESERLLYQVEWIKQLRHVHVVPILDLGVEQGQPYVVSPYLSGGSLRRRLDSLSLGRLSLQEALNIIAQVGQALSYFHSHAHLHQNIKPENIFFNEQNEVLLADFRLTGFIDVAILDYQSDPRNMCYMAPEQFVGSASEKSDQYALACLAYELLAGRVPFSAQSFAMMWASHYAQLPVPLSDLVPDLPKWIGKVVLKAMEKDPSERYADISAFLLALEGAALSPAPAITRPLALSALDPFAVDAAKPLKNKKSDAPNTTSLTGTPSEGSLANAPFGMSLAGAGFETSLTGTGFGMSLPGAPFGTSLPGNPFTASISGMMMSVNLNGNVLEKALEGDVLEKALEGNPFEADLAGNAFEIGQQGDVLEKALEENPFEADLAGNAFEMGQQGDVLEKALKGNLFETSLEGAIFERALGENPFETDLAGNPFETDLEEDFLGKALRENPFETGLIETPLTTQLLERWERASNEPYVNTGTPAGGTHNDPFSIGHLWRNTKYSIPALWSGRSRKRPIATRWLMQLRGYLGSLLGLVQTGSKRGLSVLSKQLTRLAGRWKSMLSELRAKKTTAADEPVGDALIKPFSVGRIFQYRRDSIPIVLFGQRRELPTPAMWLVLTMSTIVLIGGMVSYAFLLSQSSSLIKSKNTNQLHQTSAHPIDTQLIAQPVAHITVMPTAQENSPSASSGLISQPVQASLTGSYAEQSQIYDLSTEGKIDWIDWGLKMPGDVNRRNGSQPQISTFVVIRNGQTSIIQRASYNASAKLWWFDGTPTMMAQPQQASGVYVTGISAGFSLTVPTSTTSRTLRVYVGANGARGKFTASLNGKTYVDETLSTAYNSNGPQANGIYTLVFSSSVPNQVLTVTYTAMTTDTSNGYVLLQAATLQ